MTIQHCLTSISIFALLSLSACSENTTPVDEDASPSIESSTEVEVELEKEPKIGATLNKKVELAKEEIPADAMATVLALHPNFSVNEVEKEFKHDNVYLDLEGEVDGTEIEFDMLQTENGWEIVEVQRDLVMEQLPPVVADVLTGEAPDFEPKRIIESKQFGTDITIFEFYAVSEDGTESRKEVKLENGEASLLEKEWKH